MNAGGHIQCFDVPIYIQMQRSAKVASWSCPVCREELPFFELVYDAWFQNLLTSSSANPLAVGCKVKSDSSWEEICEPEPDSNDSDEEEEVYVPPPPKLARLDVMLASAAAKPRNMGSSAAPIELLDSDDELF